MENETKILLISLDAKTDEAFLRRTAAEKYPKLHSTIRICSGMDLFRRGNRIVRSGMETLADLWESSQGLLSEAGAAGSSPGELIVLLFSSPRWGLWPASSPIPKGVRLFLISGAGEDLRPAALWGVPVMSLRAALREMEKERFFACDVNEITRKVRLIEERRLEAQTRHRENESTWTREMERVSGDMKKIRSWLTRFQLISAAACACALLGAIGIWTCISDPNIPMRMNRVFAVPVTAASADVMPELVPVSEDAASEPELVISSVDIEPEPAVLPVNHASGDVSPSIPGKMKLESLRPRTRAYETA